MTVLLNFAELDLRGAFDIAIMIEEDAQLRYEELSRLLGAEGGGAGDIFRMMAQNESKHRSELEARRRILFAKEKRHIEVSVRDVERPAVDDDDLPTTAREALELCLEAEERAYRFYEGAIPHIGDPGVRAFFQELMEEEVEHQAMLRERLDALGA